MRTVAEIPDMNDPDKEGRTKRLTKLTSALIEYRGLIKVIDYLDDMKQNDLAGTVRAAVIRLEQKHFEEIN